MQTRSGSCSKASVALVLGVMLFPGVPRVDGQELMSGSGGPVNLFPTDMAVLSAGEIRKDLPCVVNPIKPLLGFDLRFHAGYDVSVPLKELAGGDNILTMVFRVYPENHPERPAYFSHRMRVPPIDDEARGEAVWQGVFDLGEGRYHVDWLMRDRTERVCSSYWDAEAALPAKDRQIALVIAPNTVERAAMEQFGEEPPVRRVEGEPLLNVKMLINFAPQNSHAASMQPLDTSALVQILRTVAREPRIGKFSLVAFNMQEQRVIYRQESADRIDFPALGEAISSLKLGTVDLKRLSDKHGDTDFLTDLIQREVHGEQRPDAVIFAGPKVLLDANVPAEALRSVNGVDFPLFYMNYNLNPQAVPWKDAISHTVKFFHGTEYTISRPRDLWFAVTEMVGRIVKSRNGRHASAISTQ